MDLASHAERRRELGDLRAQLLTVGAGGEMDTKEERRLGRRRSARAAVLLRVEDVTAALGQESETA
jgi:hypothetical protein